MSIISLARNFNGDPNLITMVTDNSAAEITTNGYFTGPVIAAEVEELQNGVFETAITDLWLIYVSDGIGFYTYNSSTGAFVALTGNAGLSSTLSSGNIFVGNASNVATGVAMSGDATISNTGALLIANTAINTAKLATASVTLAKLAAGITPAAVIKFFGQTTTVGGSATEVFTITGAVAATDRAFVEVVNNGTNNVTVLQSVVTTNTLTITFSGDPAADTVYNYQLIRAAS